MFIIFFLIIELEVNALIPFRLFVQIFLYTVGLDATSMPSVALETLFKVIKQSPPPAIPSPISEL